MKNITVRKEKYGDYGTIREINNAAFHRTQESDMIDKLRKKDEFLSELSLVAIIENIIAGHILFFPITITSDKAVMQSLSLAPMAVLPDYQKKGIGGALVSEGLRKAEELGYTSVVVLGHPDYYPRFGFKKAVNWHIREPFGVPDDVMMAIELQTGSLDFGGGMINYPEEYYAAM